MPRKLSLPSWIPTLLVAVALYLVVSYASSNQMMTTYWYQVIQIAALTAISALGLNLIYGFNGQFSLGHIGFYAIGAYGSGLITKDYVSKWSGGQVNALAWMMAAQVSIVLALVLVRKLRISAVRDRVAQALKGDFRNTDVWVVKTTVVLVLSAVVLGVCGVFGVYLQKAFNLLLTQTVLRLPEGIAKQTIFFIALLNGATMAALMGYLVGLPLLRLGSDYFGIATLGFSIMVYTLLQNSDQVIETMKGARGMVGIPLWTNWPWVVGSLVVSVIIMRNLIHSSHGRAVVSVREDEIAARTMGIDIVQQKAIAFSFGAFFAGLAGGLYAHLFGFLHPSTFNFIRGFDPMIIIVFGGLGSMTGTIVASGLFALMLEGLRVVLPQGFEDWRFVVYPIILLLIMLLRQGGLLGTREWGWLRAPVPPKKQDSVPGPGAAGDSAAQPSGEDA